MKSINKSANRIALGVLGVCVLQASQAMASTFTFQPTNGIWNFDGSWLDENGVPGTPNEDDLAIIPTGKTCNVNNNAAALSVDVDGVLRICSGKQIILYGDSTVDGEVTFMHCAPGGGGGCGVGTIHLNDSLTIDGTGTIVGHAHPDDPCTGGGVIPGVISGEADQVLTLGSASSHGVTILGYIDVQVETINFARIGVDQPDDVLTLSTNVKTGKNGGLWFCDDGTLDVSIEVKDESAAISARWEMDEDAESTAVIEINAVCDELTGDFLIEQGTLDVNASLCSGGQLTFQSVSGSQPVIDVAGSTSAKFSQGCP